MTRTDELIHSYLDGSLAAEGLAELETRLLRDPAAADTFARACRFDSLLEQHFVDGRAAELCDDGVPDALPFERAESPDRRGSTGLGALVSRRWVQAAAAMVLLVAGVVGYHATGTAVADYQVVAGQVLVDGVSASHIPLGSRVEVLGSQSALVRMSDGSQADLEPTTAAVFRARGDAHELELDQGGATFHVGQKGQTVRVDTPGGSVLARGTEFSVKLRESPAEEIGPMSGKLWMALTIAVVAGQVQVESTDQKYTLKAGESRDIAYEKKPTFVGKVVAVAENGREITLEGGSVKPGADPPRKVLQVTAQTKLEFHGVRKDGAKPTVGYAATAWLDKTAPEKAVLVVFGAKEPRFSGVVVDASEDGREITLEIHRKNAEPTRSSIAIGDDTRLVFFGAGDAKQRPPAVGDYAHVWQSEGEKSATEIKYSLPKNKLKTAETAAADKPAKPKPPTEKPDAPKPMKPSKEEKPPPTEKPKPKENIPPVKKLEPGVKTDTNKDKPEPKATAARRPSTRDPSTVVAAMDRIVAQALAKAGIPASPPTDDAEFIRRASLDIAGRIPTLTETMAFLDSNNPAKRRELIELLVGSREFGDHFGRIWRRLIWPPDLTSTKQKQSVDRFGPWLAEQFAANRPWNEVVTELLTTEVEITRDPRGAFFMANGEGATPKPNLLAAATGRLFLGVQIGCAECHHHPFSEWKQEDFWSLAAFYGRVRTRAKGDFTLTEAPPDSESPFTAASITIPEGSGKGAGKVVSARFLGGESPQAPGAALRPQLAAWLTAKDNPYFARALVNRLWAHFFGRGLVHPVDDQREGNDPTHPELLKLLADEFVASDFDVQHIVRCICLSQAYQRSARPLDDNAADVQWLSHHASRAMTPDMLYDSLHVAVNSRPSAPPASGPKQPGQFAMNSVSLESRDTFVRFFGRTAEDLPADQFGYGIPQMLKLLNAREFNAEAPFISELILREPEVGKRIETLYLATLSRRPTSEETARMMAFVGNAAESVEAYQGVFWMLLNSSEFVVNH